MRRYRPSFDEPSLRELMRDPMVRLLMERDHVHEADLEGMIRLVSRRLHMRMEGGQIGPSPPRKDRQPANDAGSANAARTRPPRAPRVETAP